MTASTEKKPPIEQLEELFGTADAQYSPGAVANWFIQKSQDLRKPIDHMQLQKLIYFAHGRFLAQYGNPLVNEPAEAWRFGPVFPSVYHEYKKFGAGVIPLGDHSLMWEPVFNGPPKGITFEPKKVDGNDSSTQNLLAKVWGDYSHLSGIKLSDMTHRDHPANPWHMMRDFMEKRNLQTIDIPNSLIQRYFEELQNTKALY